VPQIDKYLRMLVQQGASDLHMLEGQPPKLRTHGHVAPIPGEPPLTGPLMAGMMEEVCPAFRWRRYVEGGDTDFACALGAEARFRGNFYRHAYGHGAVFRLIPTRIQTLQELGAPPVIARFAELRMGLVLVTGPTGSGKSTTLAAMLNHMNERYAYKIVTLEDPIEFVHPNKKSVFLQREIGEHTTSFAAGLRAAGREDVNVILVGEMRDLETIALALSAAEMGVLVFGTLHTNSAAKTIDRIVNAFPADQQHQVLSMLSTSLRGVVAQQLLRRVDGKGRIAVREVLVNTPAASAAIREGQIAKINQVIQSGKRDGMMALDEALLEAVQKGLVSAEDAYLKAIDKAQFEKLVNA
jgi:twitching motility protein PilT